MKAKKPSGAANRRAARERENPLPPDDAVAVAGYVALGAPDLDEPEGGLDFARRCQLVTLHQIATTAAPTTTQRERWRMIKDMTAAIGMTHPRAKIEKGFKDLKNARRPADTRAKELTSTDGIFRPATSRRSGVRDRGDEVSGHVPRISESEDDGNGVVGGRPLGSSGPEVH